jgi:hypothetical protein
MPAHLSDAWLAALDDAAQSHEGLAAATAGVHLVIEQVIVDRPLDDASGSGSHDHAVVWHVAIHDGTVHVVPGPAAASPGVDDGTTPLVRFTTDRDTARAVAEGTATAQGAFMAGRLRVGGDTTALVTHNDLLRGLGDIFADVTLD